MEALNKILIIKGILAEKAGLDPQLYSEISAHFDELKQLLHKGNVLSCKELLQQVYNKETELQKKKMNESNPDWAGYWYSYHNERLTHLFHVIRFLYDPSAL